MDGPVPEEVVDNRIGIGLDSCLIPIRDNLFLIQSTDFFYPLIDNPYLMGKITCANVVSDVYATGVTEIDSVTIIISICDQMTEKERDVIMPIVIQGFQDNAKSAGIKTILNNAVINPWLMIGGTATSVCTKNEFINPRDAKPGDVLVLTKPLGAQISCNAKRWSENPERWEKYSKAVSLQEVTQMFDNAVKSMCRLNKNAAVLMHKHKAKGSTDVTGFGIIGHAENLVAFQTQEVTFIIHTLPVLKNVLKIAEIAGNKARFLKGTTPETSGGLLIIMENDEAKNYCQELKELDSCDAWIVGKVEAGQKKAIIAEEPNIIEVII